MEVRRRYVQGIEIDENDIIIRKLFAFLSFHML
jgi:hypothetical protein